MTISANETMRRQHDSWHALRSSSRIISILFLIFVLSLSAAQALAFSSTTTLQSISVSENTGEKPQSKLWTYGGFWWSVMPNSSGTFLYRLDGTTWTSVLQLSSATSTHADAKAIGGVTHVLLIMPDNLRNWYRLSTCRPHIRISCGRLDRLRSRSHSMQV